MIENNQVFDGQNESGNDDTDFQRAYLTGSIGVVNVTAGRYDTYYSDGNVYDDRVDAVNAKVKFGQTYLAATYGKMGNASTYSWSTDGTKQGVGDKFVQATLGGDIGKLNLEAAYLKADDINTTWMTGDDKIWTLQPTITLGMPAWGAMYLKGDNDSVDKPTAMMTLRNQPELQRRRSCQTRHLGPVCQILRPRRRNLHCPHHGWRLRCLRCQRLQRLSSRRNLTLAKNMVAQVEYYDLKSKGDSDNHARTLWSQMVVTF